MLDFAPLCFLLSRSVNKPLYFPLTGHTICLLLWQTEPVNTLIKRRLTERVKHTELHQNIREVNTHKHDVSVQQRRPLARRKNGEKLHAAAQPPSERGGGVHRTQPVTPLTAPQQRHAHEEPEESVSVHLVRQEAVRDQPT